MGYSDKAIDGLVHAMLKRENVDLEIIDGVCYALNTEEATLLAFARSKWDTVKIKVADPRNYRIHRQPAAPGHTEVAHLATDDDLLLGIVFEDAGVTGVEYSWIIMYGKALTYKGVHEKGGEYKGIDIEEGYATQAEAVDALTRNLQDTALRLPQILAHSQRSIHGTLLKHRDS